MYLQHFGLSDKPFGLSPSTAFYCDLPMHAEALDVLKLALADGEGFIKVTGEVGTGKTLLCRRLLSELAAPFTLAYLPNPDLSPGELRWALAMELGLKQTGNIDQQQLGHLLQRQLIGLAANGRSPVVIIDEAQALPDETLEALRLLTNLETESRKLLQVVLLGQPELDARLRQHHLRQLAQRVSFHYRLRAMNRQELRYYVGHRLRCAGSGKMLFSGAALWALYRASRGIPRLVNILCHKALLLAFGKGLKQAGWRQMRLAIRDTESCYRAAGALL
ncbi:ExeA family protein [Gallaecimonas pentaromativorans]|uniref:MSHA biogenesis protein MshM n=1 Tax=Gallaecimonas pentaromativorans TaxID=584787 RepID=A0A3N1PVR0_9GAMM|nr:AAA family ATPase [Gallaecimonas pentaromativorans]MED5527007.1 AAA family ATPase [Pseudomonadota bacterium]ROQ30840.1 MSHA biogenesis protein MshM [Gallaecimonas pentaromativorans]